MTTQKPIVIYHANCTDGFTAAWCFHHRFGEGNVDFYPGAYGLPSPSVVGRRVFLVDFSYPRETVYHMVQQAKEVTLIDHHKTALEDLQDLEHLRRYVALDRSGAGLAWDFLFPDIPRPTLVNIVEDRDLWKFELPHTKLLSHYLRCHEQEFHVWDSIRRELDNPQEYLAAVYVGQNIERKHVKEVRELVSSTQRFMTIGNFTVPVANIPPSMASDAGNMMAYGHPFAACYYDSPTKRAFSLRSIKGDMRSVDVSEVAKCFGGGGHENAAGFTVPREHYLATQ